MIPEMAISLLACARIAAECDEVLPAEITRKIHASAQNANTALLYIVPGSNHTALFPTRKDFLQGIDIITRTCLPVPSKGPG